MRTHTMLSCLSDLPQMKMSAALVNYYFCGCHGNIESHDLELLLGGLDCQCSHEHQMLWNGNPLVKGTEAAILCSHHMSTEEGGGLKVMCYSHAHLQNSTQTQNIMPDHITCGSANCTQRVW